MNAHSTEISDLGVPSYEVICSHYPIHLIMNSPFIQTGKIYSTMAYMYKNNTLKAKINHIGMIQGLFITYYSIWHKCAC